MRPQDQNDKLLEWIAHRLLPEQVQDAARIEKLLAAVQGTPFSKSELTRILQKARGVAQPRLASMAGAINGVHAPARKVTPKLRRFQPMLVWTAAAAACVLLAAGWLLWNSGSSDDSGAVAMRPSSVFLLAHGQAIVRPNGPAAKVFLINADKGQVRLDQGGVYLATTAQANVEAEVQTPLGRVSAADAHCFIYCLEKQAVASKNVLAVLVLDGQVQVNTRHGFEMAEAGELIVADAAASPEKISPTAFVSEDEDWTQAQDVLLLLHRTEILDQLQLIPRQRETLALPPAEEIKRVDELCQTLPGLNPVARKKCAGEFFTHQAKQMQDVLNEPQKKEFHHMCIQHAGFSALLQKEVSSKLNLSPEQKKKIQEQLFKFGSAKQGLFLHGGGTSLDLSKNMGKLAQDQADTIKKMLNHEQWEKWGKFYGKGEQHPTGFGGIGQKGFSFNMFAPVPRTEEQLWDAWLVKTAKRVKMTEKQMGDAAALLHDAKKEAADYRNRKQLEFQQLAMDSALLQKSKKYDKQAWQVVEQKANALQRPLAEIGEELKEDILDLLTPDQHHALEQVSKKELPPNMGFHGIADFFKKRPPKKGFPGFDKHK